MSGLLTMPCPGLALLREVETAAWLLDRGANIHINDGQALFEGAYHGSSWLCR